jgi:hypothetical protein
MIYLQVKEVLFFEKHRFNFHLRSFVKEVALNGS